MAQSVAPNRVYQDFEPYFEWAEDEGSATLTVMLPGFRRDQMKVQVTSTPVVRINGEREVTPNVWRRFAKEFPIPPYCDTNEVSAKFERGMLRVKFPFLQASPSEPQEEEAITSPPEEPKPEIEPEPKLEPVAQVQEGDQQKSQQKVKEPIKDEKEKSEEAASSEVDAGDDKKVRTNGVSKTAETTRLKTRVVDFTLSSRSADDKDVNQCGGDLPTGLRRPKILMNIIVAILLVMVLGTYVKNAFRSSSREGSKYQKF